MQIFNILGSLFGYVLWAIYSFTNSFGIAIIIFTFLYKVIMFPSSVKQQKSMAANSRLQAKQKALQEKYGNDKQKYNEELQKLYEKENINPFSGCLTSFLPLFILLGIYPAVRQPISNVLHIASEKVSQLFEYANTIPGLFIDKSSLYSEIDLLRVFNGISSQSGVTNILTGDEIDKISQFSGGFNFLGLDLLVTPKISGGWVLIIPILCLITSVGMQLYMMFKKDNPMNQQQGCMKYMFLAMPLFTAWLAYTLPAALGLYWITQNVFSFIELLIKDKFYSHDILNAKAEAAHIARLELDEKNY